MSRLVEAGRVAYLHNTLAKAGLHVAVVRRRTRSYSRLIIAILSHINRVLMLKVNINKFLGRQQFYSKCANEIAVIV